jgi:DNA-binding PadR family transcriptional regulator
VTQGALYPALHRLTRRGWITSGWAVTENNRRARYSELTREGRRQLGEEVRHWRRLSAAVDRIVATA